MLHHILDVWHNNFFLVAPMALLMKFWTPSEKNFPKVYTFAPPPPPPPRFIVLNIGPNVQNVLGNTNSEILKMYL